MAEPCLIDWASPSNEIQINPRTPIDERTTLLHSISKQDFGKGKVCLATSGSTGQLKWVVLAKSAILSSASAVNHHLQSTQSDIWFNPLPTFHVGGLGIHARAYLTGAAVVDHHVHRWSPEDFVNQLADAKATLTSLVPAQVFDLVSKRQYAPATVRAVIVGGGALIESLYFEAITYGWRLLPSYGLTECSSQVATAELGSWENRIYPTLAPLGHVTLAINECGVLKIKSHSLLDGYIYRDSGGCRFMDPKEEGWFTTEDSVCFENGHIKRITREGHFIKIGGESVDLQRLERILDEERLKYQVAGDVALAANSHERLGQQIILAATSKDPSIQHLVDRFQLRVFPFERIRKIYYVDAIPRSPLKKVLKAELQKNIDEA